MRGDPGWVVLCRGPGPAPCPQTHWNKCMQNQLGFFFNAWRPRLAFLYAGVQGPLRVLRLLVTRCIFQCFCVYLLGSDFDFRDCWSRLRLSRKSIVHGDCASRSGLLSWLNFYCGCFPSPVIRPFTTLEVQPQNCMETL